MKSFKFFLLLIMFGTLVIGSKAQGGSIENLAQHLNAMFKQRSAEVVKNDLSENFSVAAYTLPSAERYLQIISERYACDSVEIKGEEKVGETIKLNVIFYPKEKKPEASSIYVDKEYKILYLDLFDKLYGMNRYQESRLVVKIPFETDEHGSVFLNVRLNENSRVLKLLFDTGADGMALSQELADAIGVKATRQQSTSVVGGRTEISVSENNILHLDTFSLSNQNIALFKEMKGNIDGIIGNSIARMFITKVDYDKKELSLYTFGSYEYEDKGISIPVKLPAGVFIIPGSVSVIKDKPYDGQFVFDIGAAYNLICFRPFVVRNRLLVDGFKPEYSGSTNSMGMNTPTFSGRAASFSFANMPPVTNMPVTLMSGGGQSETWKPGFDGSIGTRIISRYNFTINMQKKEIYFSPNKSYNYPYDFVLDNFLLGFDNDGKLRVQSQLRPVEAAAIKPGATLKSINGITAENLLSDKKTLSRLLSLPAGTQYKFEVE